MLLGLLVMVVVDMVVARPSLLLILQRIRTTRLPISAVVVIGVVLLLRVVVVPGLTMLMLRLLARLLARLLEVVTTGVVVMLLLIHGKWFLFLISGSRLVLCIAGVQMRIMEAWHGCFVSVLA